jgi:hypothetical protein
MNYKKLEIMNELELLKQKLREIISKSQENFVTVWSENLEDSVQGIVIDDVDNTKYNGWFDDLIELSE